MRSEQANWFTVYTKPRQERIALENLERQGFRCFLPMAVNPYQRRSARGQRIEPLFPRYLFLNAVADQQSLGPVRSTRGVATLVRAPGGLSPSSVMCFCKGRRETGPSGSRESKIRPIGLGSRPSRSAARAA